MIDTGSQYPRARRFVPRWALTIRAAILSVLNLMKVQGHFRTIVSGRPIAPDGSPTPWFTYSAIAYLEQFDFSNRDVFEFGSGNSTLYWQSRVRSVVAVEDDPTWFAEIDAQLDHSRVDYRLITAKGEYVQTVSGGEYDLIIIDGSHREDCVGPAIASLKAGGMIILDNADWFPDQAGQLRDANLLEVDFTGFGPINRYTSTTSLFMKRDVRLTPKDVQPRVGRGGLSQNVRPTSAGETPREAPPATEATDLQPS
jgi:hypothetical protein